MTFSLLRSLAVALFVASVLPAHFTWVAPSPSRPSRGTEVSIEVGRGHVFPQSEILPPQHGLEIFAVTPAGKRVKLGASQAGLIWKAGHTLSEAGLYRICAVQDAIFSRTPQGMKAGGRDQHPNAVRATKEYRSSIAFLGDPGQPSPLGLAFEAVPEVSGRTVTFTVLRDGKPFAGAQVNLAGPGLKEKSLGKSDAAGRFTYRHPGAGSFLLVVEASEKAPAGQPYDSTFFASVLYFDLP
jgi:uncharacterized GH25 family protein